MGRYERATAAAVALWLVLGLATVGYNGPLHDEAVHITAGQRALQGYGLSGGDLAGADGSLAWPFLAAAGHIAGGLAGARAVAVSLMAIALLAVARATGNLFGPQAGFWAAVSLGTSGAFLALARLAVPDAPAVAGVAVALLAVTELARRDHRAWLLVAVLAYGAAVLSAYYAAWTALPLLGVLFLLRRRRAAIDTAFLGFTGLALAAARSLPWQPQLGQWAGWGLLPGPAAEAAPLLVWAERLYLLGGPLLLAAGGWLAAGGRRALASALLLGLAAWPAYQALTGDLAGESRHLVVGLILASPLMGAALGALWRRRVGKVAAVGLTLGLAVLGGVQCVQLGQAWPDLRQPASFLAGEVRPGDRLLANEAATLTMHLYRRGAIRSPWDVCDAARLSGSGSVIHLCDYDWFVDVEGSRPWPPELRQAVRSCRTFRPVYTLTGTEVHLGPELRYVVHPVRITIWRNMARGG